MCQTQSDGRRVPEAREEESGARQAPAAGISGAFLPLLQRFSSTSYGWKAPIASRPPGATRSRLDATLHAQALFPPIGPRATLSTRTICLDMTAQGQRIGAGAIGWEVPRWVEGAIPGIDVIGGRRQLQVRRPARRRSRINPPPVAGLVAVIWFSRSLSTRTIYPELHGAGSGNWCRRHLPGNPAIGGGVPFPA